MCIRDRPANRVHWIPNGVDTERFRPDPTAPNLRKELGVEPDAIVIGAVGRLNPVKRFDRLIRSCKRLTSRECPIHLWIAGQGDQRAELEALAKQNPPPGGKVHFLGYRTDLEPLYRSFDALVISSDSEQQPVSQLEAMASGVPLVATAVGDVPGTLPELGRSLLVDLKDTDVEGRLAAKLDQLLAEDSFRQKLTELGRKRVIERYSKAAMLEAYGRLYGQALEQV